MTKAEQLRLVTFRSRFLEHATEGRELGPTVQTASMHSVDAPARPLGILVDDNGGVDVQVQVDDHVKVNAK